MGESLAKRKMRRLLEIANASKCKHLFVMPNIVEWQILLRACNRPDRERSSKMIRRFVDSMSTSSDGEKKC